MNNTILLTDSYKTSHYLQYPQGTEEVSSYIEARGGAFPHTLFFGLQAFIQEYLLKPITLDDIDEAHELITAHGLPFNRDGWMAILNDLGGYLPLEISAVSEGFVVPTGNVLVQAHNTDRRFPWITSYMETALLRGVWYPTTVATLSFEAKRVIWDYLQRTSDDPAGQIGFKLHDFGARGVSSEESAMLGGMAHLVNFRGTDTLSAILGARKYYQSAMAGFSIPAAEHSTITSWERDGEENAYRNMLTQFAKPGKTVAVVSDSYDIFKATSKLWGKKLKDEVLASGATVVVRPDSGNPPAIVYEVFKRLAEAFGTTTNRKGYAVLNPAVRIIQGDGMDMPMISEVLECLTREKISGDNVAFGMGGGLLQKVDRDTQKWAMKCSAIKVNGMWRDVYKEPVTDHGKTSKRGRLSLVRGKDSTWHTSPLVGPAIDELQPIFRNGKLLHKVTMDDVRERAGTNLFEMDTQKAEAA